MSSVPEEIIEQMEGAVWAGIVVESHRGFSTVDFPT